MVETKSNNDKNLSDFEDENIFCSFYHARVGENDQPDIEADPMRATLVIEAESEWYESQDDNASRSSAVSQPDFRGVHQQESWKRGT